jgi:diguanylate cyclase (GGDEF)-like protein
MSRAAYGLAVLPVLTDWVDTGHWPQRPREFVTEIVVGLVILFGVWRLHRRAEHFRALSQTDSLTGVGNRARFRANLDSALARASVERCHVTIAMVDIDHFKAVNDTLGHATGDEVLREVAGSLARSIRQEGDGCFRLGGDEFAVLMIGVAPDQALVGLRRGFDRGKGVMGRPISCSIGVVTLREGESSGDLVNRADRLMYRAKRGEAADRDHGEAFGRATLGASVTDTVGLTGPLTSRTDGTRRRGQPPADS